MNFFIFVAALFFTIAVYELINLFKVLLNGRRANVITFAIVEDGVNLPTYRRRTTLEAALLAVLPQRFDPNIADTTDVMALLRRSGYYYANPGEFFAAAIRDFSQYLIVGAGLAVIPEVAAYLKISRSKIYYLVSQKQIPHLKVGRNVRIRVSDLQKWLELQTAKMPT